MEITSLKAISNVPNETQAGKKVEKKSGKRIGFNYIILKSLKESQKNDVVKCLYIKSLINFGVCVIKEGSFGESKDSEGRDIKDRLLWQQELHRELADKLRLPKFIDGFEENGNYYLALERVKGKSLSVICNTHRRELREALISGNKLGLAMLHYMIQIVELLQTLHANQVIHRDVTAANFMVMPSGKVAVIDFELSYSLNRHFPAPPFKLGTYGYMSPEQEETLLPTPQQDIYSVGAVLLYMWTGISPNKITDLSTDEGFRKISFLIPDRQFAEAVYQCFDLVPEKRPTLDNLDKVIRGYISDVQRKREREKSVSISYGREQIWEIIQESLCTFSSPLLADEERGWFSEDKQQPIMRGKKRIHKVWYASFYKGSIGVMYMLNIAHRLGVDISSTIPMIHQAVALVGEKYINGSRDVSGSLYYGSSGIAVCMAEAIQSGLLDHTDKLNGWIKTLVHNNSSQPDLLNGLAGQALAHVKCMSALPEINLKSELDLIISSLIGLQQSDGSWINIDDEKRQPPNQGFARGVSGIVYCLLEHYRQFKNEASLQSAIRGLDWLMNKAVKKKETVYWQARKKKDIAPSWCEGTPGIILPFLKAYKLTGVNRYKQFAVGGLLSLPEHLFDGNLSQCHGLSGFGEIYMEAFKVLKEERWQQRCDWLMQVIIHLRNAHPKYGNYWLVENEHQPVPELMCGNSGILHFLLRYCHPQKVSLPLL